MLDIKRIREKEAEVRSGLEARGADTKLLDRAIEAPATDGVRFHHMITVCLVDKGSIEHVINELGPPARCKQTNTATLTEFP